MRHKDLISKAKEELKATAETVSSGLPIDMVSITVKNAISSLGEILGESVSEDVLKKIFEKFCVGK